MTYKELIIETLSKFLTSNIFNYLYSIKDKKVEFIKYLINNTLIDSSTFLKLDDQDLLFKTGLKTQLNTPINFDIEEINGSLWKPYNEGASAENGIGDYFTFDEANDPKANRLVPSMKDFEELCKLPNKWALYQGQFGRLFDGRLFIPAGGFRSPEGTLYNIGRDGLSWSSSVTPGTIAYNLYFDYSQINPNGNSRAYGFQLRCLVK